MRNLVLYLLLFLIFCSSYGAVPTGYYSTLEGKKTAVLKTELHNIICQDTTHYLDYGSGPGKTWEGFYYTDRDPATNAVIDMYSANVRYFPNPNPSFSAFGSTIEIEHSVPKSWWGCDITHPDCPAKDLNHLFPADGITNMSKNDNPLGVVSGIATTNNGVSKVGPGVYDGYTGNVFEPADEYKGDFARAYFYMATAYEHYAAKWDTSKPENMMQNNRYPVLKPWAIALLLQWHRQDPVSIKETTRNDVVYGIQKNRNPFIDNPKLVEYIWGDRINIPFRLDGYINFPYLSFPTDNDTINFGKTYYQQQKDTTINLKAANLTGDLTLTLGGVNAVFFSLNKATIPKAEAEAGTTIRIHYQSSVLGNMNAILSISGAGISPLFLKLKTNTSDEFAALPPTNTSNSGFVATWTPSAGATDYSLNVYSMEVIGTNPTTLIDEEFLLALPNGWAKDGYVLNTAGTEKFGSGTQYGKLTLPVLNLANATSTLTVRAKQFSTDNAAPLMATLDNQLIATWPTTVDYQDFTVDMPVSTASSVLSLYTVVAKRVILDKVKLVLNVPINSNVSVAGFPKLVGNVNSYTVSNLLSSHSYFYTVTPIGNGGSTSNQIAVQTLTNTAFESVSDIPISWSISANGIELKNLHSGSEIRVFDAIGKKVFSTLANSNEVILPFTHKGLYLLQIADHQILKTLKVLY